MVDRSQLKHCIMKVQVVESRVTAVAADVKVAPSILESREKKGNNVGGSSGK